MHKSCLNCDKHLVCRFKPDPYMGSHSDGPKYTISYKKFANKLFNLTGKYCEYYFECKLETTPSRSNW